MKVTAVVAVVVIVVDAVVAVTVIAITVVVVDADVVVPVVDVVVDIVIATSFEKNLVKTFVSMQIVSNLSQAAETFYSWASDFYLTTVTIGFFLTL